MIAMKNMWNINGVLYAELGCLWKLLLCSVWPCIVCDIHSFCMALSLAASLSNHFSHCNCSLVAGMRHLPSKALGQIHPYQRQKKKCVLLSFHIKGFYHGLFIQTDSYLWWHVFTQLCPQNYCVRGSDLIFMLMSCFSLLHIVSIIKLIH